MTWRLQFGDGVPALDLYWTTREAAVAWALRYIDARIVDSAEDLTAGAPTVYIEQVRRTA